MAETITKHERNLSAFIHGATLGRFFFPLGQFLFPLLFWLPNRKQYAFVDYHGKQALNFQISMALYALVIGMISFPFSWDFFPIFSMGGFSNGHTAITEGPSILVLWTISGIRPGSGGRWA